MLKRAELHGGIQIKINERQKKGHKLKVIQSKKK